MALRRVAVVGPGRLGRGLASALGAAGWRVTLLGRSATADGAAVITPAGWAATIAETPLVLVAVPDDRIPVAAQGLKDTRALTGAHVVLHTSGARDKGALGALAGVAGALGSFAPVQTVSDPATAAERLRGAYVVVEGDDRACQAGAELAEALGMVPVALDAEAKAGYHAGAVLVANLGVALAALAERVAREHGVAPELAARIYLPLWRGALQNVEAAGPVAALTGPIRRGDVETVRRHLALLEGEARTAYVALATEALRLAREGGLEESKARAVEETLSPRAPGH
ncbi:MAG TPA: DUF2520 domain-containing protein [Gemmatimonadales bacterium]|nr:DUF2520 domain-containing protein [Gemmatimonadales bacterium]